MKRNNSFTVKCLSFETIQEFPNSWAEKDFEELLKLMPDKSPTVTSQIGLKETVLVSLNTYDYEEAAKIILDYVFAGRLTKGQILSISNEMLEEKSWEEQPDLSIHKELFIANQLLYQAFSGQFPYPDAVQFRVSIKANEEKNGIAIFDHYPEATLIRLLVAAMPADNLIFRLFEEQVAGTEFKDAKDIIWQLRSEKTSENELIFDIVSSSYWFQDFKCIDVFEAETHADVIKY